MLRTTDRLLNTVNLTKYRQETGRIELNSKCLRNRFQVANTLYKRNLKSHYGCVNALELSKNGGEFLLSGGDDRRILLWRLESAIISDNYKPIIMKSQHESNIFCVDFDCYNKTIFSGGNDDQVIAHDASTGEAINVYFHQNPVYRISTHPNVDSLFLSAGEDGRICMFDMRAPNTSDPFVIANYNHTFHGVAYNPVEPVFIATANSEEGVQLWDIRRPKTCYRRYGSSFVKQSAMSVCFDKSGQRLMALRRRQPPSVFDIGTEQAIFEFDHLGYYNSCTMKSGCFAGQWDDYVISGSDDFNVYVWKIPKESRANRRVNMAHLILKGHRSIVNQVRFKDADHTIYSCGVEKLIKLWSTFPTTYDEMLRNEDRAAYSHRQYINLILDSRDSFINHDYTNECIDEDPRMMAFFDSLVQRELDHESNTSSDDEAEHEKIFNALTTRVLHRDSTTTVTDTEEETVQKSISEIIKEKQIEKIQKANNEICTSLLQNTETDGNADSSSTSDANNLSSVRKRKLSSDLDSENHFNVSSINTNNIIDATNNNVNTSEPIQFKKRRRRVPQRQRVLSSSDDDDNTD